MSNFNKSRVLSYRIELDNSKFGEAISKVEAQMTALNKHVEKMMGSIASQTDNAISRLGATFEKFNRVQGVILTTATATSAAVKQMGADSNTAATQLGKLNAQVTSLNKRSGSLAANIQKNTQGISGYNVAVGGLAQATGAVGQSYHNLGNQLKITNGMFDESTRIVRSAKNDLFDLARINAMVVASFATAIGVPTKFFGDFEKELISLKALGEFSTEQLQVFSDTAKEVSVDIGQMSKDIASAGIEMVRLGLTAEETNIAMKSTADAALANSISIIRAAEIGVGTTRAMGKEISELEGVLDVMTKTSLKSASDMESLAETFKYAAPIADSAGNSFTELSAATAILSQRMIRSSQAGTTLRGMYTRLQRPVGQSKEILDALGITIKDQNGKMLPLLDITQQLGQAMEGMSKSTKNAAIEVIFGKYALSGATALINATADEVNYYRTELENATGANRAMADEMKHGVNYEFNKMQASLGNAAIAMGESFAPAVIDLLQSVTELSEGFQKMTDGQIDSIAQTVILTGKLTTAAVVIGSAVLAVRTLVGALKALQITTAITAMFQSLGGAIGIFTVGLQSGAGVTVAATTAFGTMAATIGPLILLFGAAAIAAKGLYDHISNLWKEEQNYNSILESQIELHKIRNKVMKEGMSEAERLKKGADPTETRTPEQLLQQAAYFQKMSQRNKEDFKGQNDVFSKQVKQYKELAAMRKEVDRLAPLLLQQSGEISAGNVKLENINKNLAKIEKDSGKESDAYKKAAADAEQFRASHKKLVDKHKADQANYNKNMQALYEAKELTAAEQSAWLGEKVDSQLEDAVKNIVEPAEETGDALKHIRDVISDGARTLEGALEDNKIIINKEMEAFAKKGGGQGPTYLSLEQIAPGSIRTSHFGKWRGNRQHAGEDIAGRSGSPILAANDATVAFSGWLGGYGNTIILDHGDGNYTLYGHNSKLYKTVNQGVKKGEKIAAMGSTGYSTGPHSHVEAVKLTKGLRGEAARQAYLNSPRFDYDTLAGKQGKAQYDAAGRKKQLDAADIQAEITRLQGLAKAYGAGSREAELFEEAIEGLRNKLKGVDADYAKDTAKRLEDLRKKANDYVKNILENEIPKLMDEAEKNMATEVGSSFQNELIQIEKDFERAKATIVNEFGELGDTSEIVAAAATKRLAQLSLLSSKTFADLQKQYREMEKERKTSGMTAVQAEMEDLKLQMAELESGYNVLKQVSEADPTNIGAAMGMQMVANIRKFNEEKMTDLARRQFINETLLELEQDRVNVEKQMIDMQNQINTGMMGESEIRNAKIQETVKEIGNLKYIFELESKLLGGNLDEKRKRHLEHQRALNEAYKTLTELQNETFEGQLKLAQAKFDKGLINTREHLNRQIEIYNALLDDPSVIQNQTLYNSLLTARNALLMRNAAYTNDIGEMVKTSLQFLLNSKNLTEDIDWGGYKTNMTEIIDRTVQWGESIATAIGQFSGAGDLMNKALGFASGVFGGIFEVGFGAVSKNPMAMIDGVVRIIGSLGEAWETLNPSQEKVTEAQRELNKTIIDLDLQAESAAIKVRELRGEITAYQAQLEQGNAERRATAATIKEDEGRLAELKRQQQEASQAMGVEAIPILGWLPSMARTAMLKSVTDEILQLEKKLSADREQLAESELENAKKQTEQRIDNEFYYQKMRLEVEAETARLAGKLSEEASIRRNIKILELEEEFQSAVKELGEKVTKKDFTPMYQDLVGTFQDKLKNIQTASSEEILNSKREENEKLLQFEYDRREHEVYMMREGIAKKIALINLERDQETERLKAIQAAAKDDIEANKAKTAWMDNEEKRLKDLTEAWADYFLQISEGLAESQANLNGPLEQIDYNYNKAVRDAQREFTANAPTPRGLFDVQAFAAIAIAQQTRDNKIKAADRQRDTDKIQYYSNEAKRIGEIKLLEAQNTKDQSKVLRQELQNRMDDLEWWRANEIANAKNTGRSLTEIDRDYWAQRIGFVQEYQEKAGDWAVKQFNDLKELRDLQFQEDSRFYENELLKFERQIADYQKARDDIQAQIDYYEGLISDKQREFEDLDKSLYQAAFSNISLPDEIREGLEAIANPTDVPNSRFSRDTQRKAIEEHISLLRTENEALKDYEDISMSSYWTEASRIATIGGKFYQSLLDDEALMEKMTREEQVDIRKKLSEEYMAFQEAEKALQEAMYEEELKRLDDEAKANEKSQKKVERNISDKRYELELLTRKYEDDGRKIEDEIRAIEMAHGDWAFSLEQVRENFEGLITSIKSNYGVLKEGLGTIVPTATGWALQSTDPSAGGTGSGFLGAGGATASGGRSRTQGGSYLINGGDGWYYASTSDMMAYQSQGYADGFMVKNMDKYKGDNAYMGNGMRFDANEALIPLDKFWHELERTGGDAYYNYDMRNSTFRSEDDIVNAIERVKKRDRMRWGMNHGTRLSGQGAR